MADAAEASPDKNGQEPGVQMANPPESQPPIVRPELPQRTDRAILTHLASLPGGFACAEQTRTRYDTYLVTTATGLCAPSAALASLFRSGKGDRRHLWAFLLGVQAVDDVTGPLADRDSLTPHQDEGQVLLDVNRSFSAYPVEVEATDKAFLRSLLENTIVNILRRFPTLSYFQGYHDVVSIFLLTFVDLKDRASSASPTESHTTDEKKTSIASEQVGLMEEVVKRFTLHRIRDSMACNLDPVMGYLRVTQAILTQEHPRLSSIIAQTSNLPLFSLSWILTLTSHDLTSFEVISRLFDLLLCHNPIMICYIACAICLTKVEQIDELIAEAEAEGGVDFDMVHFVMSKLPKLHMAEESHQRIETTAKRIDTPLTSDVPFAEMADQPAEMLSAIEKASKDGSTEPVSPDPTTLTPPHESSVDQTREEKVSEVISKPEANHLDSATTLPKPQSSPTLRPRQDGLSVESIVHSALLLYSKYPPTDPRLKMSEILGPKSCLNTWEQSITGQLTDTQAATILTEPLSNIALPDPVQKKKEERKRALARYLRRKKTAKEIMRKLVSRNGLLTGSVLIGILSIVYFRPHNEMGSKLMGIYEKLSSLITRIS